MSHPWLITRLLTVIALLPLVGAVARANESEAIEHSPEAIAFFEDRIKPILVEKCFKCHGTRGEAEGELRLISRARVLEGGELGPAVDLDDPKSSSLIEAINHDGLEMPPSGKLPPDQIALLTRWVNEGLPWTPGDDPEVIEFDAESEAAERLAAGREYWAYQPIGRPEVPEVERTAWVQTPIDAFVLARLEAAGLEPAPAADRTTLLRRATFDLTGLPPTPDEVAAFLADESPDAFGRVVERLLASPHYGEKWGRHWLDLVRYGETDGYERDATKKNAWRYRDYVIRSFNEDKPYDRFVLEQLAGDELDNRSIDSLIATGYYRLGLWDDEPVDADQAYYDSLDDVVSTTGQTFMGMTIGCARCHEHKIDPLPQRDYYRLLAYFHNTLRDIKQLEFKKKAFTLNTQRVIATDEERAAHRAATERHDEQLAELKNRIDSFEDRIFTSLSAPEREDAQADKKVLASLIEKRRGSVLMADELAEYLAVKKEHDSLRKTKVTALPTALAIKENGREAPDTFVLVRGSAHSPGEQVEPGVPAVLAMDDPTISEPAQDADSSGRRLALARWLVDERNPLTSRVMANRLWQHHFGRGLVRNSNDFGLAGAPPTHPELLDWLASELIASDWSLKEMHRRIMTSAAYRMSSTDDARAHEADPTNDLFWRFDMRRLTAEEVRDSILAVTGQLNRELGGPSVYTAIPDEVLAGASRPDLAWGKSSPEDRNRRSVYVHVKRSLAEPVLKTFDSPDTETSCAVRFVTTVPTQSLSMLNGAFFQEQAAAFADRLETEADGVDQQVARALTLALSRTPSSEEIARGTSLIAAWQSEDGLDARTAVEYYCLLVLNLNEFVYLD